MLRIPEHWEKWRLRRGPFGTTAHDGPNGFFSAYHREVGAALKVQCSNGAGWEHVSVSIAGSKRTPTWDEMDWVCRELWEPEDAVIQLHPPRSLHVNHHPGCLHLWRSIRAEFPLPPRCMVGPYEGYEKDLETLLQDPDLRR